MADKAEVLQGTLDTLVLKTLAAMGPLHGYGIGRRIEQISGNALVLNQGTIYPALLRLEQRGWIRSDWGKSEKNRRARFYAITRQGQRQLTSATEDWKRTAALMGRFFELPS
jgi:PadR family transcriptional regulator, regulatory protein PadR